MTKQKGRKPGSRNGVYATRRSLEEAEKLFLDSMALVGFTIKKMEIPFSDDTLQDGYLGLWKAAMAFDDTQGMKFSSYAIPAIRGEIVRGWQRMNKNDTPVLSLDTTILFEKSRSDKEGIDDGKEFYNLVRDTRADDMLQSVEFAEWLGQTLNPTEKDVVQRRLTGDSLVDINKDYGKSRGWAEHQINKAKKAIKKEYFGRMKHFG